MHVVQRLMLSQCRSFPFIAMIGQNGRLVTDEPVEFDKEPVEVQDCRKITHHFRGICGIDPNSIKEKPKDVNM